VGPWNCVRAQETVALTSRCDYFSESSDSQTFKFPPDADAREIVRKMLSLIEAKPNFQLYASNVATVTAGFVGKQRIVLYNQVLFGSRASDSKKWIGLAIFAHAVGHHVNSHSLTHDPDRRKAVELEADRFAAYILFKLGASAQQAAWALQSDEIAQEPAFYPSRSSRVDAVIAIWNSAKSVRDNFNPAVVSDEIPEFQWPPPKPSAMVVIPNSILFHGAPAETLGGIGSDLEGVFDKAGYSERSFYSVPDGFALVSRLEQINDTGQAVSGADRWSIEMKSPRVFSVRSYLSSLFKGRPGRFRVIAFIVTQHPISADKGGSEFEASRDWLWSGANRLPSSIADLRFTPAYACTALIYEFEHQPGGSPPVQKLPGSFPGKEHLEKAMIWQALGGSY